MGKRNTGGTPVDFWIANRIQYLRVANGETQKELGEFLGGVSSQVIGYYENGKRLAPVQDYINLAKHYGVTVDYLLGLTDAQTTDASKRAACDYTGLTEAAVAEIKKNSAFRDFIDFCAEYITTKDKTLSDRLLFVREVETGDYYETISRLTGVENFSEVIESPAESPAGSIDELVKQMRAHLETLEGGGVYLHNPPTLEDMYEDVVKLEEAKYLLNGEKYELIGRLRKLIEEYFCPNGVSSDGLNEMYLEAEARSEAIRAKRRNVEITNEKKE